MSLNTDQQAVVNKTEGAIALIAGPGSGKTSTLAARYESLVEKGVSRDDILCVTFTKEAAETMQKRVGGKGNFRTFHSLGYAIMTAEAGERRPFEPELRHRLLTALTKRYGVDYKGLTAYISKMRHKNVKPADALTVDPIHFKEARAYAAYETQRAEEGWIDFDSMIADALALLENPAVRARHQYRYVMADEMQDCDESQMRMLQLITEKHGNLLAVGDTGQSIHQFRGAKPENLTEFRKWFPSAVYMYLGMGYRSTQTITEHVKKHYPLDIPLKEQIRTARNEKGAPIEYRMFLSEQDEVESAIAAANRDPLNSIILSRTNQGLAWAERFCRRNQIPFTLLGKSGFFRQPEIIRAVEKLKPYGNLPVSAALSIVLPSLERHYQVEDATAEDNRAFENVRKLREIGADFPSTREFVLFANKAAHSQRKKGITLSTVHQAKGGEWTNVFTIGARRDNMPHAKGLYSEEECIWLVAISRAKDRHRISFTGAPGDFLMKDLTPEEINEMRQELRDGVVRDRIPVQESLF